MRTLESSEHAELLAQLGESWFVLHHIRCGRVTWPDGQPVPLEAMKHVEMTIEAFDSFIEVTRHCTVCEAREVQVVDDTAAWRRYVEHRNAIRRWT